MKNLLKNWKTSLAGLFGLASLVAPVIAPQYVGAIQQAATLAVSLGLIAAEDSKKKSS